MYPHPNVHKFTLISRDGKTHSKIDHILIDSRRHLSVLDVPSFMVADYDTDHYLAVAKVRERLTGKQCTDFIWRGSVSKK
jgi:putative methionine-R-sulfoxide reductase with GAF domain